MPSATTGSKHLVLTAMIFAVAMMFIDQAIVAIAVPDIDRDLHITGTGAQWIINGYLLALAALFALGGKLSDVVGHRTMVLIGIAGFAVASALCGAAPSSGAGEAWLIAFRIVQGAFGAILFPSALAIAAATFDVAERGKALALFFGITGALTSVGPLAGGFLIEWTWRAIFWINIPVALIALALTLRARPLRTGARCRSTRAARSSSAPGWGSLCWAYNKLRCGAGAASRRSPAWSRAPGCW